jgi:predicted RNA-binding Zn ribbon-like protein
MKSVLQVIAGHRFETADFVGGDAPLDFINTVSGRDQGTPRDRLDGYGRLLEWAAHADLLPGRVLRTLAQKAQANPAEASAALARAKRLRETMFAVVASVAIGKAPAKADLELLRNAWLAGCEAHRLHHDEGQVVLDLDPGAAPLDLVSVIAAWGLVERVFAAPAERLRLCQGTDCAWTFLDSSKAGRRRWCDMAVCGNAAKSRRHYARNRGAR